MIESKCSLKKSIWKVKVFKLFVEVLNTSQPNLLFYQTGRKIISYFTISRFQLYSINSYPIGGTKHD